MNRFWLRTEIALAIACCFFLSGCGGSSPMTMANFDKIQEGMTIEQVSEIMGFPPPDKEVSIVGGVVRQTRNDVDREHNPTNLDGLAYDEFHYKEMGGRNKKDIFVTYQDGKVTVKNQTGLE
jgi:hypothetical protein